MLREIKYFLVMLATGFAIGASLMHLFPWLGISAMSTFWLTVLAGVPLSILSAVWLTKMKDRNNG